MSLERSSGLWNSSAMSIDTIGRFGGVIHPYLNHSSAAWPTQYKAIYVPVRVTRRVIVKKLWIGVNVGGTTNGDLGVYNSAGVRLVSIGSTAVPAAEWVADITDTTLVPGLYYMAGNMSNATITVLRIGPAAPFLAAAGVLTETLASEVLPATATWAVDQTLAFMPAMGMLVEPTAT